MPTALVAVEQCFPTGQRVIEDGLAARLLPLGALTRDESLRSLNEVPGVAEVFQGVYDLERLWQAQTGIEIPGRSAESGSPVFVSPLREVSFKVKD